MQPPGLVSQNVDLNNRLPWLVQVDPLPTADANVGWDTISIDASMLNAAMKYNQTGGASSAIQWTVVLGAGTWTDELVLYRGPDAGITTVALDGATLGTLDGYAAAGTYNVRQSIAGVNVGTPGAHVLKLTTPTKNASSTGFYCRLNLLELRRTA